MSTSTVFRAMAIGSIASTFLVLACGHSPAPQGMSPTDKAASGTPETPVASSSVPAASSEIPTAKTTPAVGSATAAPTASAGASDRSQGNEKAATADRNVNDYMEIVQNNRDKFRACYETSQKAHPDMQGKVVLKFVLAPDGSIKEAGIDKGNSDIADADLDRCLTAALKTLVFPASKRRMESVVRYPFHFTPHGTKK